MGGVRDAIADLDFREKSMTPTPDEAAERLRAYATMTDSAGAPLRTVMVTQSDLRAILTEREGLRAQVEAATDAAQPVWSGEHARLQASLSAATAALAEARELMRRNLAARDAEAKEALRYERMLETQDAYSAAEIVTQAERATVTICAAQESDDEMRRWLTDHPEGGGEKVSIPEQARLGAPSAPPEGFRLVPLQPTEGMLEAAWRYTAQRTPAERMMLELADNKAAFKAKLGRRYQAMVRAAPEPPAPGDGAERVHEGKLRDEPSPALEVAVKALERIAACATRDAGFEQERIARQALVSIRGA